MRALLASANVRRYLAAQLLSLFGDSALWLALGIWVKSLTGSSAAAGLVFFAFLLPSLGAPLAGLVVDRVRRRPLLITVNLVAAGAILPLLLVHGRSEVWAIYAVTLLYGVCAAVISSAQSALLTVLVPRETLGDANGVLQTGKELLRLAAPLVGAGLFAWWGSAAPVVLVDAATFVVAAALLLGVRVDEPAPEPSTGHLRADVLAGVRHIRHTPLLARMVFATAVCTSFFGFFETIVYAIADALHRSPSFVGVLVAAQGIGAVAGGATAAPMMRRLGELRLAGLGLAVLAFGMAALPVARLAPVLAGTVVFGVGVPWLVVALITAVQRHTPGGMQGRVMSAADVVLNVPTTVSIAAGAVLIAVVDYRVLVAIVVAVTAVVAAYLLTTRVPAVPDAGQPVAAPAEGAEPPRVPALAD